jgi:transposase
MVAIKKVGFNENTLIVVENTGIYHRLLWAYCGRKNLQLHIGNAAHIKWSFGIARGKSDKIDSQRLCYYACKESDMLKSTAVLNPVLLQLKDLMTARTKLLSQVNSIKTFINELKNVTERGIQKTLEGSYKKAIEGMQSSIKSLEAEIKKLIVENGEIEANYKLLLSVPGIGHFTAVYLICCTNNFAGKISGKQLASYAGVVPFEYSSGISVRGRKKVHPMANKELKKMLYMCAMSAIQYYPEFKQYYERKEKEGKHGWSIMNAIKNKIVLRAVAVVNKQEPYVNRENVAA